MQILEALILLGLSWNDRKNKEVIKSTWKKRIHDAHPDRNDSRDATRITQALNEAKEVLLRESESELENTLRERHEEMQARKREQEKANHKVEEETREKESFMRRMDEILQRQKEIQRERYNKNRRKRAPDSRAHRKIEEYPEGKALIEEMKSFFKNNFVSANGSGYHVLVTDIMEHFVKSRDATSILEKHLFQRHSKKIIKEIWPNAKYSKSKNKRSYMFIAIKEK